MKFKLKEAFELIRNGANIKQGSEGGYPITRIETISERVVNKNKMGYAGIYDLTKYEDYLLAEGDILMSHINSEIHLGKTAIYEAVENEEKIIHGMNLICLRPKKDILYPKFAFYYFNTLNFKHNLNKITKKSVNQASFSVTDLKKFEMEIPYKEIQIKVANLLDKSRDLIYKRKAQIEALDILTKSVFFEMFGDSTTNHKNFPYKSLSDIASVGSSKRVFVKDLVDEGVPFYRGTEIGSLALGEDILPTLFVTEEHYNSLKLSSGVPNVGDLLMPSICPDGRIWRVQDTAPFYFKDGRVLWIHFNVNDINTLYIQYALKDKLIRDYSNIASGTTFAELKIFSLKTVKLMIPSIELQNKFASFVEEIEIKKKDMEKSLQEMEHYYNSLLHKAFKGELFQE